MAEGVTFDISMPPDSLERDVATMEARVEAMTRQMGSLSVNIPVRVDEAGITRQVDVMEARIAHVMDAMQAQKAIAAGTAEPINKLDMPELTAKLDKEFNADMLDTLEDKLRQVAVATKQVANEADAAGKKGAKAAEDVQRKTSGWLDQLKGAFGKGSLTKELVELAIGGGVVAGFTLLGDKASIFAASIRRAKDELIEGKRPADEVVEELARALPIYGGWISSGLEINELFTGQKRALREANEEAARLDTALAHHREVAIQTRDTFRSMEETIRQITNRGRTIGLAGPLLASEQSGQSAEDERLKILEDAKQKREAITGPGDQKLNDAKNKVRELDRHLDAIQREFDQEKAHDSELSFDPNADSFQRARRLASLEAELSKTKNARDEAARPLRQMEDSVKGIEDRKNSALKASEDVSAKERAQREKDLAETRERDGVAAENAVAAARTAAQAQALRNEDQALKARIAEIRAAAEAEVRNIDQERKQQVKVDPELASTINANADARIQAAKDKADADVAAEEKTAARRAAEIRSETQQVELRRQGKDLEAEAQGVAFRAERDVKEATGSPDLQKAIQGNATADLEVILDKIDHRLAPGGEQSISAAQADFMNFGAKQDDEAATQRDRIVHVLEQIRDKSGGTATAS